MEKEKFLKYSLVLVLGLSLLGSCSVNFIPGGGSTPSPSPEQTEDSDFGKFKELFIAYKESIPKPTGQNIDFALTKLALEESDRSYNKLSKNIGNKDNEVDTAIQSAFDDSLELLKDAGKLKNELRDPIVNDVQSLLRQKQCLNDNDVDGQFGSNTQEALINCLNEEATKIETQLGQVGLVIEDSQTSVTQTLLPQKPSADAQVAGLTTEVKELSQRIEKLEKSNFDLWLSAAALAAALGGVVGVVFLLSERNRLLRAVKSLKKEMQKIPASGMTQVDHASLSSNLPYRSILLSREEVQKLIQQQVLPLSQQVQNLHQFPQQTSSPNHRDLQVLQDQIDNLNRAVQTLYQAASPSQKYHEPPQQNVVLPSDELSHQNIPSKNLESDIDASGLLLSHSLPERVAKRVETYNIDPKSAFSSGHDIEEVSETPETVTGLRSSIKTIAVEIAKRNQGSYWLFENEWLFPKKISQSNYETVPLFFICQNDQGDSSRDFQLIRPAKVSRVGNTSEKQEWNLKEQGELKFID